VIYSRELNFGGMKVFCLPDDAHRRNQSGESQDSEWKIEGKEDGNEWDNCHLFLIST